MVWFIWTNTCRQRKISVKNATWNVGNIEFYFGCCLVVFVAWKSDVVPIKFFIYFPSTIFSDRNLTLSSLTFSTLWLKSEKNEKPFQSLNQFKLPWSVFWSSRIWEISLAFSSWSSCSGSGRAGFAFFTLSKIFGCVSESLSNEGRRQTKWIIYHHQPMECHPYYFRPLNKMNKQQKWMIDFFNDFF